MTYVDHRVNIPNLLADAFMWGDMITNLSREKFPHTDMVKLSEDKFEIHLSLAGYKKENISIFLDNSILTVEGEWDKPSDHVDQEVSVNYLMHGIAKRSFKRMFPLAEHTEVSSVRMEDGILKINVDKKIPDALKPKTFEIQ